MHEYLLRDANMLLTSDLELLIASAYSEGRARFGDLELDLKMYADRIRSIIRKHLGLSPAESAAVAFVKGLHCTDLYLATACAQESCAPEQAHKVHAGDKPSSLAWKTLGATYQAFIHDLARLFFRQRFVAQDIADNILADLFFPDSSGNSRIISYDGRSSLCTWLRVVVYNRAINARRCKAYSQTVEIESNIPDRPALINMDRTIAAKRYSMPLKDSVASACSKLSAEERLLLLWRYEDGLQLGRIAELLGIHQSNVTRRLERIQGRLRDQTIATLSSKYHMTGAAIEECLSDVTENPRHALSILDFIRVFPKGPGKVVPVPAASRRSYQVAASPKHHGTT
jgi:RNA polymerase sigma-70 factor